MDTVATQEAEASSRTLARWGSLAAAVVFGAAFFTDERLDSAIVQTNALEIGLIVTVFVGYALAWAERLEALGSLIAVAAIVAVFVNSYCVSGSQISAAFALVGLPALVHLTAVVLHGRIARTPAPQA